MKTAAYKHIAYTDTVDDFYKPPILILHGWMQDKESWEGIIALLSKEYRVICPDLQKA